MWQPSTNKVSLLIRLGSTCGMFPTVQYVADILNKSPSWQINHGKIWVLGFMIRNLNILTIWSHAHLADNTCRQNDDTSLFLRKQKTSSTLYFFAFCLIDQVNPLKKKKDAHCLDKEKRISVTMEFMHSGKDKNSIKKVAEVKIQADKRTPKLMVND